MQTPPMLPRRDTPLAVISLAIVAASVMGLGLHAERSIEVAERVLYWSTHTLGTPVLVFGFLAILFVAWLACSRYGRVRLGHEKPSYKTSSWIFMFVMSGLGSSTLYWGFLDWAYYYQTPGLNLQPESAEALHHALAYSFFHSGLIAWALYAIGAVAMGYHYHVRKRPGLSLAAVVEAVTGFKSSGPVGRLIDLLFMLCMFGALTISLVLTALTFAKLLSILTGWPDNFLMQLTIIVSVAMVFTVSSWLGMDSGMKRLSEMVCWGVVLLTLYVLFTGPTRFIINYSVESLGIMASQFIRMSLFTDPLGNGQFSREWTAFYWLWWISYAPGVALFVARVSRGRSIREVILAMVVGGASGMWFVYGVLESYSVHAFASQLIDVPQVLSRQGGEVAIGLLLQSLPAGSWVMAFYLLVMAIFLAAHMDAVGYAVTATCTRQLREGQDPAPADRLFWCLMLTLVPLVMVFIKAPLNTMKTAVIVTALPFSVVLALLLYGLIRWLREDYGHLPAEQIAQTVPAAAGPQNEPAR